MGLGSSAEGRFWRGAARSRALSPGLVISSALLPEGSPRGRRFPGTGCFGFWEASLLGAVWQGGGGLCAGSARGRRPVPPAGSGSPAVALSQETWPQQLKLRASPSSLRKQGTGSQLPGPRLLFLSVPGLWAGSEQHRPAGQSLSRGQAAPAPRAALLAPHGRALCTGAVSWKPWRWLWGLVVGFSSSNHPREWRGAVQERCAREVQQQQASFVLKALVSACLGAP